MRHTLFICFGLTALINIACKKDNRDHNASMDAAVLQVKHINEVLSAYDTEPIMIAFISPGECEKCLIAFERVQSELMQKHGTMEALTVGAVHGRRSADIALFRTQADPFDKYVLDSSDIRSQLGIPIDTRVFFRYHIDSLPILISQSQLLSSS